MRLLVRSTSIHFGLAVALISLKAAVAIGKGTCILPPVSSLPATSLATLCLSTTSMPFTPLTSTLVLPSLCITTTWSRGGWMLAAATLFMYSSTLPLFTSISTFLAFSFGVSSNQPAISLGVGVTVLLPIVKLIGWLSVLSSTAL